MFSILHGPSPSMHELSLAENLISLVEAVGRRESAGRIAVVVIEVGELSAIEPDALGFAFDVVKTGGLAKSARLDIVVIPGEGRCGRCGEEAAMPTLYAPCPACGSHEREVLKGREMRVREILIEEAGR